MTVIEIGPQLAAVLYALGAGIIFVLGWLWITSSWPWHPRPDPVDAAELTRIVQNANAAVALVNADVLAIEKRIEMLEVKAGLK